MLKTIKKVLAKDDISAEGEATMTANLPAHRNKKMTKLYAIYGASGCRAVV